jgi:hypothetical protein
MPHNKSIKAMLCRVGVNQRFFGKSTGADDAATRDPSRVIFVTHYSDCCIGIKRHYKAIIYGPLVVGIAADQ